MKTCENVKIILNQTSISKINFNPDIVKDTVSTVLVNNNRENQWEQSKMDNPDTMQYCKSGVPKYYT